jgi:N-acetylglucosaminyl-diphospho-decaprenol L-rhamnosyltransferase
LSRGAAARERVAVACQHEQVDGAVDCAVLVVTYNSVGEIEGLLDSLPAAAGELSLRTVVVDNGSTDGTIELVRGRADIRFVASHVNLGYAGGINLAREHAGAYDSLLVLNPDITFAPGAILELFGALCDHAVGVAVPMILDSAGRRVASLRREPCLTRAIGDALLGGRWPRRPGCLSEMVRHHDAYAIQHSIDWATGAVVLVSAVCDTAVGPWDERFFMYSEEVDYAARARASGFAVNYVPSARAQHRAGASGSSLALTALMAVNRVRYIEKRDGQAGLFRAVVMLHELLRVNDAAHRLALRTLMRRSRWADLPGAPARCPPDREGPTATFAQAKA